MPKGNKLTRPESYDTGRVVAARLRALAAECEQSKQFINCHVQLWYADRDRVKQSLERYHGKELGAKILDAKEQL